MNGLDAAELPRERTDSRFLTSSLNDLPGASAGDIDALGAHADVCRESRGFWWRAGCVADSVGRFMAPRLVTTVVVVAIALGVGSLFT